MDAGGGGRAGIVGMFWLALKRYGMNVSGDERSIRFSISLATPSRRGRIWVAVAELRQHRLPGPGSNCPRFYVFIPSWLWPGRPSMVLN